MGQQEVIYVLQAILGIGVAYMGHELAIKSIDDLNSRQRWRRGFIALGGLIIGLTFWMGLVNHSIGTESKASQKESQATIFSLKEDVAYLKGQLESVNQTQALSLIEIQKISGRFKATLELASPTTLKGRGLLLSSEILGFLEEMTNKKPKWEDLGHRPTCLYSDEWEPNGH